MKQKLPLDSHPVGSRRFDAAAMGWLAWIAAACFVIYQMAFQTSFASIQVRLEADLDLDSNDLGLISAAFFLSYAVVQIPAGLLLDRFRPASLLPAAAIATGLCGLILAFAEGSTLALISRLLMGAAAAFAFPGAAIVARARISPAYLALALGLTEGAIGSGAIIGQTGVTAVLSYMSWRWVIVVATLFSIPLAAFLWLALSRNCPTELNSPTHHSKKIPFSKALKVVLRRGHVWRMGLIYALLAGVVFGLGGLWNLPLQEAFGRSEAQAAELTSWMFLGLAIGCPLFGYVADRTGWGRGLLLAGCIGTSLILWPIIFVSTPWPWLLVVTCFLLLGFAVSSSALTFPLACSGVSPEFAGTTVAVVNCLGLLGAAVFLYLPGSILAIAGSQELNALQHSLSGYFIAAVLASCIALVVLVRAIRRTSKGLRVT